MPKRFLKFSDRWMFNRVLCEKEVCRKVLRAALGIEVGEITYLNAEQAKEPAAASRGVRMDVFAREGSRVFDIEMQVSPEDRIGRRMRYYQAAIDATELGPGEDYGCSRRASSCSSARPTPSGRARPSTRSSGSA